MKTRRIFNIGLILVVAMVSVSFDELPDGNGWRGPKRDGKVENFVLPAQLPGQLNSIWQVNVGLGDASPVLSDGKIYLHTRKDDSEVAICVDAATGKVLWENINNPAPEVTGGAASHPGPRSTPAVAYGKVFNVGAGGYLTCRNASTGDLLWETSAYTGEVPQFFVSCSPLIVGNKCIVHLNGKDNGTIVAFDIDSGKEIWKLQDIASTYSSPVLMPAFENMVVVQGETDLVGVSLENGKLLWKHPTPGETRFYNSSSPLIDGDKVVIAGQGKGTKMLRVKKSGSDYSVEEVWQNSELGVSFNSPVLKEGYIYGNEARFGYVYCLNAETGETMWSDTVKHNRFASMLDAGKVMVSLPSTGNLLLFKPDHKSYQEVKTYKVAETEVYAHPVLNKNIVYVKDIEHLTCWTVQ
jgi:outer membrane protein assembly factor BamB